MNYTNQNQVARTTTVAAESNTRLIAFYVAVASLLILQAIYTVYHGGLVVGNGFKLAQLEKQKQELAQTQTKLQQTLAENHSLLSIQNSDVYKEFQPMAGVVTVTDTHAVASR